MTRKKVVMAGPGLDTPGGMSAVIHQYYLGGFVEKLNIEYLPTYEGPGLSKQLRVMSHAILLLGRMLLLRQVSALHVNSASRGSFWRKTILIVLAKLFGVRVVFHLHSGEFPTFFANGNRVVKSVIRWVLRSSDEVICLTATWFKLLAEIEPDANLSIMGNPIDIPEHCAEKPARVRTVLFLGRLRESKGVFDLLDAIPNILVQNPQVRFIFAGDGDEQAVRDYAQQLGIAHAVVVPGWVAGIAKNALLETADIFVLPSHFEALPMSILEAMAAGIPVIATKVGGIPDVIESGAHGLLVEAKQSASLALAINQLCGNAPLRRQLANAAYCRVRATYALPMVFTQLETVYARLGHVTGKTWQRDTSTARLVGKDTSTARLTTREREDEVAEII